MALKSFHMQSYLIILAAILCWTEVTFASGKYCQMTNLKSMCIYIVNLFLYLILQLHFIESKVKIISGEIIVILPFQILVIARFAGPLVAGV